MGWRKDSKCKRDEKHGNLKRECLVLCVVASYLAGDVIIYQVSYYTFLGGEDYQEF